MTDLTKLLAEAKAAYEAMTPEQQAAMWRAQLRSIAVGEAGFGSDEDEAAYRRAVREGDEATRKRLDLEADARQTKTKKWLDDHGY